ncbi:DUF3014 domain-containing protein [soil metagenome]
MSKTTSRLIALAAIVLLALAAFLWWRGQQQPASQPAPVPAAATSASSASRDILAAAPVASAPAIAHPIEALDAPELAASAPSGIEGALVDLFGRKRVLSMFQASDFPHRIVATVDNLGRSDAPAHLWPVNPTPGRFSVLKQAGGNVISPDNGLRYLPFVLMVESVDPKQLVAFYRRLYPQLQQAYEDIGFPNRYFNDRLVEVIDLLLATPTQQGSVKVLLPQINGPVQPKRPWVLYEYEDPALRQLSSGQKLLLRMGPNNEERMKAKLSELRKLVASDSPGR